MEIVIKTVEELDDGSALVELKVDVEGHKLLIQEGLISILKKAIQDSNNNEPTPY